MKYFVDSSNIDSIKKILEYFPIDGVTTNPTIISRESRELLPLLKELRIVTGDKLLFIQVTKDDAADMVQEAVRITQVIGGNLCIKVPATVEGLKAIKILTGMGISVTATAVYSAQQALLCAKAGCSYVAPYMSHIDDMCLDSIEVAAEMAKLFSVHFPNTQVLAASFRVGEQINRVILSGVGAVTIAPDMFYKLMSNHQTEAELSSFNTNWSKVYKDRSVIDMIG